MIFSVRTPSTTSTLLFNDVFSFSPLANLKPNAKFLLLSLVEVAMRSPNPAAPKMPDQIARARYHIQSFQTPLVMSNASIFLPKPRPLTIPEASAMMFLYEPLISAPLKS